MRFCERLAELGVVKPAGHDRAPWEDRQAEVLRNRSRPKTRALAASESKPKLTDLWREVAMGLGFGALAVAALHFVLSH